MRSLQILLLRGECAHVRPNGVGPSTSPAIGVAQGDMADVDSPRDSKLGQLPFTVENQPLRLVVLTDQEQHLTQVVGRPGDPERVGGPLADGQAVLEVTQRGAGVIATADGPSAVVQRARRESGLPGVDRESTLPRNDGAPLGDPPRSWPQTRPS